MNEERQSDLIDAEGILADESQRMEEEFRVEGAGWEREEMLTHTGQRHALMKARKVLLDRLGGYTPDTE